MTDKVNPMDAGLVSEAAFKHWLAAAPGNQQYFTELMEDILGGEYGKIPPELHAAARNVAAKLHEQRCLKTIADQTKVLMEILQRPPDVLVAEERTKQCQALAEEITNVILELPEPHRSKLAKLYLPMWEKLRGKGWTGS